MLREGTDGWITLPQRTSEKHVVVHLIDGMIQVIGKWILISGVRIGGPHAGVVMRGSLKFSMKNGTNLVKMAIRTWTMFRLTFPILVRMKREGR
jgi:hypothetical protein